MLYVLFQAKLDAIFGPMGYTNPVFILMVYAPGIVGVFMVWRYYGLSGLGAYHRQPHRPVPLLAVVRRAAGPAADALHRPH